ncbi:error-prone DNA polymerase [Pseudomaricurvus alcaniphilus]|uniref:error-prone DNA polymerase n=1 Tax=Pseudomaricurvus alcaniphilus TaxID=1166482 RepID=UPI001409FB36|nr:error-prone DNA polymerase [Pseudomaricurvus alcaniphilus]NHN37754.1 error-prone DNA polymerase [Pseudomaricurvus alcaniphilus]
MFAELHCLSNFTFLRGASRPEELVARARELGYAAIAITDECSLAGVVKAHVAARELGIKLIIGSEFRLDDELGQQPKSCQLLLLAPSRKAYSELSLLITKGRRRSPKGQYQLSLKDLQFGTRHCLAIWLPPRIAGQTGQTGQTALSPETALSEEAALSEKSALSQESALSEKSALSQESALSEKSALSQEAALSKKTAPNQAAALCQQQAQTLQQYFKQRLWLGVELLQEGSDRDHYQHCYQLAQAHKISMLACNDVHMHERQRQALQDTLSAIRHNTSIEQLGRRRYCNGERHLRSIEQLQRIYPQALLEETLHLADLCRFSLDELSHDYPEELVPSGKSAGQHLRELSLQGAERRWPNGTPPKVMQQLQRELEVIAELRYEHYFLTVEDIVRFARQQNILCQGRGSAANSVVCYCLFITEVDPSQSALLFERFISKERNEPPDIDVDFEHERREEVIQYIYRKYSRQRAALTATVITYRPRSAIRDVGKALGFDPLLVAQLAKDIAWWERRDQLDEHLQRHGIASDSPMTHHFMQLVQEILGFPRHLSQHVGGFLITRTPISNLVPVENAAMAERTIIQWDKVDIEALKLLKVDVLALGMLTAIRKSLALINSYQSPPVSLANMPRENPQTYAMLCRGDSVGVFQVESRAQMAMLPRLQPRCYYDLVIQVAIVRPGPIQGDMVHPYLKRRSGEEPVSYPNELVREVLQRTLGVPIFQEQVIKLAMVAAGFSGGEADQLRRAMASWGRNGNLLGFQQRLLEGMRARGHSQEFAERLFRQMQGFGEYGFPESHAASFALLVYSSAWLKCHYPAAFYCGLLNSLPMGFYSPAQLVQDARRHRIEVRPIDIFHSHWDHSLELRDDDVLLEQQPALRLGLRLVKGFNRAAAERIVHWRQQPHSQLGSLSDLGRGARLKSQELECLAAANALGYLSKDRHSAHWQVQALTEHTPLLAAADTPQEEEIQLPPSSAAETTIEDYRHTSLSLNQHPMSLLRQQYPFNRCLRAADLYGVPHGRFVRLAGVVTGRQRPGTASGVLFMTLEDETGNSNVVIWQNLQQRCRQAVLKSRIALVKGILERRDNVIHVIAGDIQDYSDQLPGFGVKSRDFH